MTSIAHPSHLLTEAFFQRKKVLVTGHTGFKGSWLSLWLQRFGAAVSGISLAPRSAPDLFSLARIQALGQTQFVDIRDASSLAASVQNTAPEIIFHLAAQSLVRTGYAEPLETFATNVMGTANLLEALRGVSTVRVVVVITTDKVYANREWPCPYREDDHLGGHDPYSASKAAAEIVVASYRDAFLREKGTALATARAGNVIGGGDWSADRLIPDAIRAWQSQRPLEIRRPEAVRPWQHVLEPLYGYLCLAQALWHNSELAGAWNFGPYTHEAATVRDVVELARAAYGKGEVIWGDGREGPHEAGLLTLEIARARSLLGVEPKWRLPEAVERTVRWYRRLEEGEDARKLCEADMDAYWKELSE